MKVEYDSEHDVLYLWLGKPGTKAAQTQIVAAGVHADFDRDNKVIGVEVLEAKDVLGGNLQFEVVLSTMNAARGSTS